jgi:RNA polymerase sigma-70 factor, ECF subfamily
MNVPIPSDHLRELITRAQHNDPEAYEFLYQRYVDALYR